MPIYVEMPKLSDTMTEGTLVRWTKQPGESVEMGDIVAEVETDKATMEMEAFDSGVMHAHLVGEGEKVALGERIYVLLEEGEDASAVDTAAAKGNDAAVKAKAPEVETPDVKVERSAAEMAVADPAGGDTEVTGRVKSSPLARKLAKAAGVDLGGVQGSGPGGRVVAKDVEAAGKDGAGKASAGAPGKSNGAAKKSNGQSAPMPVVGEVREDKRVPLSGMRRVIAERLLESKTTIPHFYLTIEVDAAPMMALRGDLKALGEGSGVEKVTFNDFVLKGAALAAVEVPTANASFQGDHLLQYGGVHVAVAVAVEEGLVTPVLRDADRLSLAELSGRVKDLAGRARSKKLKPEEYQGGTLTVSNLGAYGIEEFCAIINPPQAMILAVGAIVKKPVINAAGELVAGDRMRLTLSADHRVVDGAVGAEYLAALKRYLEQPMRLLV